MAPCGVNQKVKETSSPEKINNTNALIQCQDAQHLNMWHYHTLEKRKTFYCGYYGKQWEENCIGNWISLVIISPNLIKQQMCGHG